ncbi:hypothetical protein BU26DRAFT_515603 [Trematosphaeria pertusa]|uniref:Uncharacterized protein n=1 Tax=Trematosphaeria pertusa TaxID=390896 RepID=A0A6A6ISG7_9PLEO|nr:uncharacterized protein BU26DRAFT_515603 [Trematosphaeria pertusa]KAF2253229.1 hypothetical protein BU26DRAFT_515603 [Trematosphaeria pertusa]
MPAARQWAVNVLRNAGCTFVVVSGHAQGLAVSMATRQRPSRVVLPASYPYPGSVRLYLYRPVSPIMRSEQLCAKSQQALEGVRPS